MRSCGTQSSQLPESGRGISIVFLLMREMTIDMCEERLPASDVDGFDAMERETNWVFEMLLD